MTHPWLSRISEPVLREEVVFSRDAIMRNIAQVGLQLRGVPTFIYPFGDYGTREIAVLGECDYVLALTFGTNEGLTRIAERNSWYEWGYTINAPEHFTAEELWDRFGTVHETAGVFSVTTHPPVLRPNRRYRAPNIYKTEGTWGKFLQRAAALNDVWFTTFGMLAAYHDQTRNASVQTAADCALEVCYDKARAPLPASPLSVSCSADRPPTVVRFGGHDLPLLGNASDVPREGWRYENGHLILSVANPGRIDLTFDR